MFYQYCTTFTVFPLKNITKHHKCSPQIFICLISFKVIQILNFAVSGEKLQFAFNVQNYVKVTYVRHFFKFQVCTTNLQINYDLSYDFKIKTSICACSKVSRVFIYASDKPLCATLIIKHREILNLCMPLQASKNILCKNQRRIQNMY